jgi:hypothetical protein
MVIYGGLTVNQVTHFHNSSIQEIDPTGPTDMYMALGKNDQKLHAK